MKHLFNPFFAIRKVGKEIGAGLSICYGTVTNHGDRIYSNCQPEQGATFVTELPVNGQLGGVNTDDR
jgi:C4-dicarboxylate-specific signal transduction histidine kinase